jgi:hypothetical protein
MSSAAEHPEAHAGRSEQQVRSILATAEPGQGGARREIVAVRITPGAYRSSCTIDDVEVVFADGRVLRAVLKDVSPGALLAEARRVKPAFLLDPWREIAVYRHVLRQFDIGAPEMLGAVEDDESQRFALLLEAVSGIPLWQVGEPAAWCGAARWLAAMHARLEEVAAPLLAPARLLNYDEAYYARWRGRAEAFITHAPSPVAGRQLVRAYAGVIPRLLTMPRTFIHGEFHASNVMVELAPQAGRIRPVDWETAAFAPALMDLADLTAGRWTMAMRAAMEGAYRSALASCGSVPGEWSEYALDCCRLHRAIQWLCWSDQWSPPREHTQDWFGEAMRLCNRVEVQGVQHGEA